MSMDRTCGKNDEDEVGTIVEAMALIMKYCFLAAYIWMVSLTMRRKGMILKKIKVLMRIAVRMMMMMINTKLISLDTSNYDDNETRGKGGGAEMIISY